MLLKHLLSLSFLTYKIRIVISQIVLKIKEKIKEIVCFDNWRSLDERCVQEHRTIEKVGTLGAIVNCVTRHVNLEAWKPSVQVKKGGSREGVSKRDLLSEPLSQLIDYFLAFRKLPAFYSLGTVLIQCKRIGHFFLFWKNWKEHF